LSSAGTSAVKRVISVLADELGLDSMEMRVFLFLFEKRLEGENLGLSAYETYRTLRVRRSTSLPLFKERETFSDKKVSECLENLFAHGFVERMRPRKERSKRSGRRPKWLYAARSVADIRHSIVTQINAKREAILEALDRLGEAEEFADLATKKTEKGEDEKGK
jgi:hypothetical protein